MRRAARNIGLREMAREAGIAFTTLSRLEAGQTPNVENLFRLCWHFRLNIYDYFVPPA